MEDSSHGKVKSCVEIVEHYPCPTHPEYVVVEESKGIAHINRMPDVAANVGAGPVNAGAKFKGVGTNRTMSYKFLPTISLSSSESPTTPKSIEW